MADGSDNMDCNNTVDGCDDMAVTIRLVALMIWLWQNGRWLWWYGRGNMADSCSGMTITIWMWWYCCGSMADGRCQYGWWLWKYGCGDVADSCDDASMPMWLTAVISLIWPRQYGWHYLLIVVTLWPWIWLTDTVIWPWQYVWWLWQCGWWLWRNG